MEFNNYFVVDVESDGPCPGLYSMVCFGAVNVGTGASFYGKIMPVAELWEEKALSISGFTREQHLGFDLPSDVMYNFAYWLNQNWGFKSRPIFWSDNLAFDWQWINYYFIRYFGLNPFGYSGRRINDLYCGLMKDCRVSNDWKRKYRVTKHTHNPVDDARGNAEALKTIIGMFKERV